jgi:trigger factor
MAKHPGEGQSSGATDTKKAAGRKRASSTAAGLQKLTDDVRKVRAESTPILRALSTGPVPLPDVTAPSLENLVVLLEDPPAVSTDDVLVAFHAALRAVADKRPRAAGERPELGDDVTLNMLAYAQGTIVPFSVKMQWQTELAPFPHLPTLAETITSIPVGEGRAIPLVFPDDYPLERYRGVSARFLVDVSGAVEVRMPDAEHPDTLRKLGRGSSLDAVMDALAAEVDGERGEELLVTAQSRALDALAARVTAPIPAALVDEEIMRAWGRLEGGALAWLKFSADEQDEALAAWQRDPATRADAERRIRIALALRAIAERDGIVLEKRDVTDLVKQTAAITGLRLADVTRGLKGGGPDAVKIVEAARHLKAVEHVVAQVKFRFVDEA